VLSLLGGNMSVIMATRLKVHYKIRRGLSSLVVRAVDGVTLGVKKGEVLGIVGESGCGKSTLARTLAGLERPTEGEIYFEDKPLSKFNREERKRFHKSVQMVFQDPYDAINPRYNVFQTIAEGLIVQGFKDKKLLKEKIEQALTMVRLTPPESFEFRYPYELSGGQLQRVAIARALVLEPNVLIADEPVSMLDVSVRAEVLNTLIEAKKSREMSVVFVSHDIALAEYVSERLAVMYLGQIVESAPAEELINNPLHPYTQALIDAVPEIGKKPSDRELIKGEIASSVNIPTGCRFHPRCPYAKEICKEREPELEELNGNHLVACHFAGKLGY